MGDIAKRAEIDWKNNVFNLQGFDYVKLLVSDMNLRHPAAHIECFESSTSPLEPITLKFKECRQNNLLMPAAWQAVIGVDGHMLAASIRQTPHDHGNFSIVFLDSVEHTGYFMTDMEKPYLDELNNIGIFPRIAYIASGVQTGQGCPYFALSAAKEMSRSPAIEKFHEYLSREPAGSMDADPFDLDAKFFKYSQSRTTLLAYLKDWPEAGEVAINKKDQTLLQLHDENRIVRMMDKKGKIELKCFGRAIEKKAVRFYQKAAELVDDASRSHLLDQSLIREMVDKASDQIPFQKNTVFSYDDDSEATKNVKKSANALLAHFLKPADSMTQALEELRNSGFDFNEVDEWGAGLLHFLVTVLKPPKATDEAVNAFISVLTQNFLNIEQAGSSGVTPLFLAVNQGTAVMTDALLANGANVNACDAGGETPLFWHPNTKENLQLLRYYGANFNHKNKRGISALSKVAESCHARVELYSNLIEGGTCVDDDFRNKFEEKLTPEEARTLPLVEAPAQEWLEFLAELRRTSASE